MNTEQLLSNLRIWPEEQVCGYLATEIRRCRQELGLSQREFADFAGIPLRTYKRFETHGRGHLETFIRSLRVLGRTEYLFTLFPAREQPLKQPTIEERIRQLRRRALSLGPEG